MLSNGADSTILDDKVSFAQHCLEHDLPTVPVLGRFSGGEIREWFSGATLPPEDLFAKPVSLNQGNGAECWFWTGTGWSDGNVSYAELELIEHFRRLSSRDDYLVMKRIVNHPQMQRFSMRGLASVRVVTCKSPGKTAWPLLSVLRMPVGQSNVDNLSAGGIVAAIGNQGELTAAVGKDSSMGYLTHHPSTGEVIEGHRIPMFDQAKDICVRAHEAIPEIASIGWDIALSADGPVLVEGNFNWSPVLSQIPTDTPLGLTAFADWARDHLEHVFRSSSAQSSALVDSHEEPTVR